MNRREAVQEIIKLLDGTLVHDDANRALIRIEYILICNGYTTNREFAVQDGRIDLLVHKTNHGFVGIEIDRCTPRKRSIKKLTGLPVEMGRVVLLRRRKASKRKPSPVKADGIDALVYLDGTTGAVINEDSLGSSPVPPSPVRFP